jgi:hypothetical protein
MRCPKCGFNSFDHNLLCPKCRKDLTAARRLLNLSVPSPGAVDFFATAARRAIFPAPPLEEAVEIFPEMAGTIKPAQPMYAPQAEPEDIEPIDEIEEIEPEDEEDIAPLAVSGRETAEAASISPPERDGGGSSFAGHLAEAQAVVLPSADEEIEIELDEIQEIEQPEAPVNDFNADITTPPIAESALAQIKSTLTATGDLQPEQAMAAGAATAQAELWPEPEPEPEEFLTESPGMESQTAAPEEFEAPEELEMPEAGDIIDITTIPEAVSSEALISLDDMESQTTVPAELEAPEELELPEAGDIIDITTIPEAVASDTLISLDDDDFENDFDDLSHLTASVDLEDDTDKKD